MSLEISSLVWIKESQGNVESTWIPGVVKAIDQGDTGHRSVGVMTENKDFLSFQIPYGEVESDELKLRNLTTFSDKDDLIDLPFLNEPEILLNLKNRFESSKIFTIAGPILLTINPFDEVVPTESCIDVVRKFVDEIRNHAFDVIEEGRKSNQSIVISGESGSGKTESFKLLLNLLGKQNMYRAKASTSENPQSEKSEWYAKSLLSHRILESFGNAMTMTTANSSRFGKVVELNLTSSGDMIGMTTRTYLLESSRTTNQQAQERNFNIFYQILAGASREEQERWHVTSSRDYHYTNQGGDLSTEWERIDANNFNMLKEDLLKLGVDETMEKELFDALVGILHLGQVRFEDAGDETGGSKIASNEDVEGADPLILAASFLGISPEQLQELVTVKTFVLSGEKVVRLLNTTQAMIARDAISKAIYRGIFDWLVSTFNAHLLVASPEALAQSASVVLVDIFGFDSFHYNSMDQLCINYANEVLQQLFNFNVFKRDITLYKQEQIPYEDVIKFTDNKDNIDLISSGLFKILDDQCRLPDPTDKRFVARVYKDLSSNKLFSASAPQKLVSKFTIRHFSGPVEYTATGFILKNSDNLPSDTGKTLLSSKNSILVACVQGGGSDQGSGSVRRRSTLMASGEDNKGGRSSTAPSFIAQVKADLALLVKDVEKTELHYVRCLKPFDPDRNWQFQSISNNRESFPLNRTVKFSEDKVNEQLRYGGVLEAIKTTRMKFRAHLPYADFYNRYRGIFLTLPLASFDGPKKVPLNTPIEELKYLVKNMLDAIASATTQKAPSRQGNRLARAVSIRHMNSIINASATPGKVLDSAKIQFGLTLIFLKGREYETLEAFRNTAIISQVTVIQTIMRRAYWIRRYKKMRRSIHLLLRVYRGFAARLYCRRVRFFPIAVGILQRQYRSKILLRKLAKIQLWYRSIHAKRLLHRLRAERHKIVSIYGPLITARDMRMQRRRTFSGLPQKTTIAYIPPLEKRFSAYNSEEAALVREVMELVSNSKLDDEQLQGELQFEKLVKEISLQTSHLPNDPFRQKCVNNNKELKLAEHMLKLRKLTDNTIIGRFGGTAMWKSLNKYSSDIPAVNLTHEHGLFIRIHEAIALVQELRSEAQQEFHHLEQLRQNVRMTGIPNPEEELDIDVMISRYTRQIKSARKLQSLYDIAEKYYVHFIKSFVREYGPESTFRRDFDTEKRYLKALIEVVRAAKKFVPAQVTPKASLGPAQQNIYRVGNCPLKVDWREPLELSKIDLSLYDQNADYESDLVKILSTLELKKREFNLDNLRILHFDGVGYQFMPAFPAISHAINLFTRLLGGEMMEASRLVKLAGTRQMAGRTTFYQAIHRLSKTSMMDVLYNPIQVEQLDSFSFSLTVISCLVLGIFHLQPNHVNVSCDEPKPSSSSYSSPSPHATDSKIHLLKINPDVLVAHQFLDYNNASRYRIHQRNINFLFFLPQMDEPVDPDVRAFLTSSPFIVEEIISSWLRDLFDQNRRYFALRTAGITPEDLKPLNMPLLLPAGSSIEMRRRLNRICRLLRHDSSVEREGDVSDNQYLTLSQLLEQLFPPIGDYYRDLRQHSDFTEHLENVEGVVSYAYMYHQALDSEQRLGNRKGSLISSATEAASSMAGMIRRTLYHRNSTLGQDIEEGENEDDDDDDEDDEDEDKKEEDSSIDLGGSMASSILSEGSGKNGRAKLEHQGSAGFGYDEIYLDAGFSTEKIPGLHDNEQADVSMLTDDQEEDLISRRNPERVSPRSTSSYEAPNNRSRLFNLTGPDGVPALEFDQSYEQQNRDKGARPNITLQIGNNPTNFSHSLDFVQTSPFQMIQRKITMQMSSTNVDSVANLNYQEMYRQGQGGMSQMQVSPLRSTPSGMTPLTRRGSGIPIVSPSLASPITPISAASRSPAMMRTTPLLTGSETDNAHYLAYQKNDSSFPEKDKSLAFQEAPPVEFRRLAKRAVSKYGVDILGEEARQTPLNRTIEEEGFEFVNSLDWRDFAQLRPAGQAEEFCEMIGRNLTFLTSVWLNHINDWQFKALFRFWVRALQETELAVSGLKALTREVILRYALKSDMEKMRTCSGLSKILRQFHIDLKFAVLCDPDEFTLSKVMTFSQDQFDAAMAEPFKKNTNNLARKKSMKPMNPSDQYDLYRFFAEDEEMGDEKEDSQDELDVVRSGLSLEQEEQERGLKHALWTCLNRLKLSELNHMDETIRHVLEMIRLLVQNSNAPLPPLHLTAPASPSSYSSSALDIPTHYLESFMRLLVQYPVLAPIGVMVAQRRGFTKHLTILHQLIASRFVQNYLEIIFSMLYNHPEVLLTYDSEGLLPCDRIKRMPRRLTALKYQLLSRFVNFSGGPLTRSFQTIRNGIFSIYRQEEELIVWACHYDLLATETELHTKRYNLWKRDSTYREMTLLWKLFLTERDCLHSAKRELEQCWKVYQLLCKTLVQRVQQKEMTVAEVEDYLWKTADISFLSKDFIRMKKITLQEIEQQSRIYQDLQQSWARGKAKATMVRMRKLAFQQNRRRVSRKKSRKSMI